MTTTFTLELTRKAYAHIDVLFAFVKQRSGRTSAERWREGLLSETAALGLAWGCFMTIVSSAFYILGKRTGMSVR